MSVGPVRPVVVDDSNAGILYRGAWQSVRLDPNTSDRNTLPFLSTQHRTQTSGSVTYTFKGSSATMFGSVTLPSPGSSAPWTCTIDNHPLDTEYPTTTHGINWPFCHVENLDENASHTLVMEMTGGQFSDMSLDQIQYVPSSSTPIQSTTVKLAYDDPMIQYEGDWEVIPGFPGVSTGQTSAEVKLSFYGSSLTWMASTLDRGSKALALASYSIDGKDPVGFLTTSAIPSSHLFNQTMFRIENLSDAPHNLFVTFMGTDISTRLFLDYIIIENATINSTTVGSATAVPTFATMIPTAGGSSGPGNVNGSPSHGHGGHSNLGPIIGGVIGGVAFLGLVILFLLYWRRKRVVRRGSRSSSGNRAWADRFTFPNDNKTTGRPFQLGDLPSPTSPSHPRLGDDELKRSPTSPTSPKYAFSSPAATAENANPFEDFSPVGHSTQK